MKTNHSYTQKDIFPSNMIFCHEIIYQYPIQACLPDVLNVIWFQVSILKSKYHSYRLFIWRKHVLHSWWAYSTFWNSWVYLGWSKLFSFLPPLCPSLWLGLYTPSFYKSNRNSWIICLLHIMFLFIIIYFVLKKLPISFIAYKNVIFLF